MGYTHIEIAVPLWNIPTTPRGAIRSPAILHRPTYRTPKQFMQFVDTCRQLRAQRHSRWVPAHFPKDENGLFEFDGTCCYELSDPMMNEHPDWTTPHLRLQQAWYSPSSSPTSVTGFVIFMSTEFESMQLRPCCIWTIIADSSSPINLEAGENLEAIDFAQTQRGGVPDQSCGHDDRRGIYSFSAD